MPPSKSPKSFAERLREALRRNDPDLLRGLAEIVGLVRKADPRIVERVIANAARFEQEIRRPLINERLIEARGEQSANRLRLPLSRDAALATVLRHGRPDSWKRIGPEIRKLGGKSEQPIPRGWSDRSLRRRAGPFRYLAALPRWTWHLGRSNWCQKIQN